MNNRAVKKYIWTIKKVLPFVYNNRKRIINNIKSDIAEYAKENESCTYEELVDAFGSPEDIVNEYMSETISKREICLCLIIILVCGDCSNILASDMNEMQKQIAGMT